MISALSGKLLEDSVPDDIGVQPYLSGWQPHLSDLWSHVPIRLDHRLHADPLFSQDNLAEIIETYPRAHYSLIHMGEVGQHRRFWREGDRGTLSGNDVIEAIRNGRLWLNLRQINKLDPRFDSLISGVFEELESRLPGFKVSQRTCGILLSSPNAQVYYHCDLPGQALFQIAGRKRIWFYPPHAPFLTAEGLEHVATFGIEVDLPYRKYYDDYALAYDFAPGQMFFWPLNAPHRIENYGCLNISLTTEYLTEEIRRANVVTRANGMLRYRFKRIPASRATRGASFWGKAVMQRLLRDTGWMRACRAGRRPVEFILDRGSDGGSAVLSPVPEAQLSSKRMAAK